jgi:hypothetical protein
MMYYNIEIEVVEYNSRVNELKQIPQTKGKSERVLLRALGAVVFPSPGGETLFRLRKSSPTVVKNPRLKKKKKRKEKIHAQRNKEGRIYAEKNREESLV